MGITEIVLISLPLLGGLVCVMDDAIWKRK
jgi:hypothetical protein